MQEEVEESSEYDPDQSDDDFQEEDEDAE